MKTYHQKNSSMRYIAISEEYEAKTVLGLTTNRMLITVDKHNERVNEYVCPKRIWDLYKSQIDEAKKTPDFQVCLYFGSQCLGTDEDI